MKFKVGDIVVANKKANGVYCLTKKGWCGTVTEVIGDMNFVGKDEGTGTRFVLSCDCFDLVKKQPKILITSDGHTTTARLYDGKKVTKTAEAKCNPSDKFDFSLGAKLAFDGLMGTEKPKEHKPEPIKLYCVKSFQPGFNLTQGRIYETDGNGKILYDNLTPSYHPVTDRKLFAFIPENLVPLVSRPAKDGEWIVVTGNEGTDGKVTVNSIHKVTRVYAVGRCVNWIDVAIGRSQTCLRYGQYLVLDGYDGRYEEQEKPIYYSGKVVCVDGGMFHTAGKIYEVRNGIVNDDAGEFDYNKNHPVKTVDELNAIIYLHPKFIEFKGESHAE